MAFTTSVALSLPPLLAYLDAKYFISKDLLQIQKDRRGRRQFARLLADNNDHFSPYSVLHRGIGSNDNLVGLVFEDRKWTYQEIRLEVARIELALRNVGVQPREVVSLMLNNSPEFFFAPFALWKIGAVMGPINTSISGDPFLHAVRVANPRFLITSYELMSVCLTASKSQEHFPEMLLYDYGSYPSQALSPSFLLIKHTHVSDPLSVKEWHVPIIRSDEPASLLYTSGTTGKPKAVMMPAIWCWARGIVPATPPITTESNIYIPLPIFHGVGLYGGILPALATSSTVVLARKFSISTFWKDIERNNITGFLYVGELCRYLVQAPMTDNEARVIRSGSLKWAKGLGMNAVVWKRLRDRCHLPVYEYFSASEATVTLANYNKAPFGIGAVTHIGPVGRYFNSSWALIAHDVASGDIVRDPRTGLCVPCAPGKAGELVMAFNEKELPFHGYYRNKGATEEKMLKDVRKIGDCWLRVGDLLNMDNDGHVFFADRLGDTYRSKGHNVSTTEVEAIVGTHPLVTHVNIFAIPMTKYGYDGQAGVATIIPTSPDATPRLMSQLESFSRARGLPSYALPRFVRLLKGDNYVNANFKASKAALRAEGLVEGMWWLPRDGVGYTPCNNVSDIIAGRASL